MNDRAINEFGGSWTDRKIAILRHYLNAYVTALKFQPFQLHYIDAFAGTGDYTYAEASGANNSEDQKLREGSVRVALGVAPPFSRYTFIEANQNNYDSLRQFVDAQGRKEAEVLFGDANVVVPRLCKQITNHNKTPYTKKIRAIAFLDPYGMTVTWETLIALANTAAVDVWYLFPTGAAIRQLARKLERMDASKVNAINRILGTDEWRNKLYGASKQLDLLSTEPQIERTVNVAELDKYIHSRLKSIFPHVSKGYPLRRDGDSGPQLFTLYLAVANPDPRAGGLALKFADDIFKNYRA